MRQHAVTAQLSPSHTTHRLRILAAGVACCSSPYRSLLEQGERNGDPRRRMTLPALTNARREPILNVFILESTTMDLSERKLAQGMVIGFILLLAAGSIGYRLLVVHHLEQTSAMFIGLPAVLAIGVALLPRTKTATGTIVKVLSLFLLLYGILLGEGFICILMASPLVLGVGCIVGVVVENATSRPRLLVFVPIVLLGLEGTAPQLSFPREEVVSVQKIASAAPADIRSRLASP